LANDQVVVVGIGMMTSVGLTTQETVGSVRAGIARFTETTILDHRFAPFTMAEVPEDGLPGLNPAVAEKPGLSDREIRMLRLGSMPLLECLEGVGPAGRPPSLELALPEIETTRPLDRQRFLELLAEQTEGAFDLRKSEASLPGRAGGLAAIGRAVQRIQAGKDEFVVAGGIDTYRALYVLGALDKEGRVKSSVHLDGFIPGEGAGFVLLASPKAAAAKRLSALAVVTCVGEGTEVGHLYSEEPYRGEGLAETVEAFLADAKLPGPIEEVYSSMNGENHWAKEWGVTFLRNRPAFNPEHGMHHPADCFGDTGAACGPLMVGLAAEGLAHGHLKSPVLVYGASDFGYRTVLALTAAS
jgi:3-oxoacyl-[acyl-carrier-protein] synthase-1